MDHPAKVAGFICFSVLLVLVITFLVFVSIINLISLIVETLTPHRSVATCRKRHNSGSVTKFALLMPFPSCKRFSRRK